jgi:hypothetical protein
MRGLNPARLQAGREPESRRTEGDVEDGRERRPTDGHVRAVEDPTTTSPMAQLQANAATVKKRSSRCGLGFSSRTRTAARLVPGRTPLNSPRSSASRFIAGSIFPSPVGDDDAASLDLRDWP